MAEDGWSAFEVAIEAVDLGVWMSPSVLRHKLEAAEEGTGEAAWNVRRIPPGLGYEGELDRLFVASERAWRGYFELSKTALYTPQDEAAPWTLLFDARSWTPIKPVRAERFRGLRPLKPGEIETSAPLRKEPERRKQKEGDGPPSVSISRRKHTPPSTGFTG